MSVEQWLMTNGSDLVRVLFGFDALNPGSSVIRELAQLVDDGSGRKIAMDVLEWDQGESRWKAVLKPGQTPPFRSQGELAYDLFKRAETAAWWLISPAVSGVYCVDGFIAGERTRIALLAKLSDMVGRGSYKGPVLEWKTVDVNDARWVAVEKDLRRFGVVGVFRDHKPEHVAGFKELAQAPDAHHRYVALWALSKMADVPELRAGISEALRSAVTDPSQDVRSLVAGILDPTGASQRVAPKASHPPEPPRTAPRPIIAEGEAPPRPLAAAPPHSPLASQQERADIPRVVKVLLAIGGITLAAWIVLKALSIL
jgi:hypothetical protein